MSPELRAAIEELRSLEEESSAERQREHRKHEAETSRFAQFVRDNDRNSNPAPRIAFDWWRRALSRGEPVDETDALLALMKALLEQNQEQQRLLMEAHQNRPIMVQVPDGRIFGSTE